MLYFNEEVSEVSLMSISGQLVYQGKNVSSINVAPYSTGVYVLKAIAHDGSLIIKRIVKK